jgi:hypothetical protein
VLGISHDPSLLSYLLDAAMTVVPKIELRNKVLRLLIRLYSSDYFAITQCCVHLNDPTLAANVLRELLDSGDDDKILIAYQVAFDLVEMATQEFLANAREALGGSETTAAPTEESGEAMEVDKEAEVAGPREHSDRVRRILTGEDSVKLYLEFLYRNNRADLLILSKTKVGFGPAFFICVQRLTRNWGIRMLSMLAHPSTILLSPSQTRTQMPVQRPTHSSARTSSGFPRRPTGPSSRLLLRWA